MGDWLIGQISIFGIQLQNWMLVALAITIAAIVYAWRRAGCTDG